MKRTIEFIANTVAAVALLALLWALLLPPPPPPAPKPEPCVTVGEFDNGRTIKVCDRVAVERWGARG